MLSLSANVLYTTVSVEPKTNSIAHTLVVLGPHWLSKFCSCRPSGQMFGSGGGHLHRIMRRAQATLTGSPPTWPPRQRTGKLALTPSESTNQEEWSKNKAECLHSR